MDLIKTRKLIENSDRGILYNAGICNFHFYKQKLLKVLMQSNSK